MATGPCDWPLTYYGCPDGTADIFKPEGEEETAEEIESREAFELMATEYLWRWTGRRFGLCEVTLRPCKRPCDGLTGSTFGGRGLTGSGAPGNGWEPALISGKWYNIGCEFCGTSCGCSDDGSIRLPGPVDSVSSVVIDGEVLDEGAYRIDNYGLLVRTDGGRWPACQDFTRGTGEEGIWAVTYTRGLPVPVGGRQAAGRLAVELALAACRDNRCQLPQRVQTITRQGVTVAMLDSFSDIDTGHTGIWPIDSWIASVSKTPKGARVISPDYRPAAGRVTTWPGA